MNKFVSLLILVCLLAGYAIAIPNKVFLNIPFTSQAPHGTWNHTYNEACEEASILMVVRYLQNKGITPFEADREILKMVDYQEKHYGGHRDLSSKQTAKLMEEAYKITNYQVVAPASIETLVNALSQKHPVIVPMAGRLLRNPYYKRPGPVYHMIVIKGYDLNRKEFITNDPGTKRGLNYRYSFNTIKKAWHDCAGGTSAIIIY